jgi:hypothetical protein
MNDAKPQGEATTARPQITSYDSGYEHSIEHWIEVCRMVDAEAETTLVVKPRAFAARA